MNSWYAAFVKNLILRTIVWIHLFMNITRIMYKSNFKHAYRAVKWKRQFFDIFIQVTILF